MTSVSQQGSTASDACERLFAEILERHHGDGADPETLFAAHPEHAETLRRWWHRLAAAGEVAPVGSGERFGRFVLLEELGAGAQGRVHLAIDTRLGRRVALKTMPASRAVNDAAIERFRREAAVASRLEHPGICTVYDAGEYDDIAFIAMQFVDGKTLAQQLADARRENRAVPADEALALAEAVGFALHAAHEAGLVHRDVKPGNIMVGSDGQPVVLDFGLASDTSEVSDLTRTGDMLGTPSYMSPEQLHGAVGAVDRRTDVYSLGVVLFECLTLQRPFEGATQQQLQQRILTAAVPDVRKLRPELDRETAVVIETALAKDRAHRYATARDFAEDLRRLRNHETVLARAIGPLRRLWRWSRLRPGLAASLAAVFAATLAATITILVLYLETERSREAFVQLVNIQTLQRAEAAAAALPPPSPAAAPRLAAWLEDVGEPLGARLDRHRRALDDLRRIGTPRPAATEEDFELYPDLARLQDLRRLHDQWNNAGETSRQLMLGKLNKLRAEIAAQRIGEIEAAMAEFRSWTHEDENHEFQHHHLSKLVTALERFTAPHGTLRAIRARLEWAREIERATILEHAASWRRAAAEVRADPRFAGLELSPQLGLIPLGPDPVSRLQEFAFARGGEAPARDPDTGALRLDAASAPVLVLLPPSTFRMGTAGREGESPVLDVTLDCYFFGKHELSRAQWRRLAHDHVDDVAFAIRGELGSSDDDPATDLSWYRCWQVLVRHGLLLPTEAQWENACRGGTTTAYWTGEDRAEFALIANFRGDGDGHDEAASVYSMAPNGFGLHHVPGNASEYCRDVYSRRTYEECEPRAGDGLMTPGPGTNDPRVVRGGSWTAGLDAGRSAARSARPARGRYLYVGLRLARAVEP